MKARWLGTCLGLVAALLLFASGAQAVHEFPTGLQLDGNVLHSCPPAPDTGFCASSQQDWADLFTVTDNTTAGTEIVAPNTSVIGGSDPDFTNASFIRDFESGSSCTLNSLSTTFCAADDTTFATGSKDTLDITNGGWQCTHSNNVNSKIDIMNTYAASYTIPTGQANAGDQVLYFGMEKNKNNGTNDVGFWFLQHDANCSSPTHANWTGSPHTVGDVLVVSEFSSGGGVSSIFAYKWVGGSNPLVQIAAASGGASDCKTALAGDTICATTNSGAHQFNGNITTPWLTSDATLGVGHTVVPPDFFEGGIDLTRAFGSSGSTAPNCFNTFVGDTRSSTSLGSTLFDFARGHLQNCGARITISPLTAVNEVNHTHTLTVHVDTRNGSTFTPAPDGTLVTLSLLNNAAGATFVNGNTCTTTSGTCTVQIISSTTGTVDIHATSTVTLPDGTTSTVETDGTDSNSIDAVKRYVDGRIGLSPLTAINGVNQAHTITATVQQDDGLPAGAPGDNATGFGAAPDGTLVTFSLLNNTAGATFVSGNTCTTTGGTCTVQINSTTAGSVDIHATATFSVGGVSLTRATGTGAPNSADANKKYVDANISITPNSAVNEVRHAHTFTITTTAIPAGTTPSLTSLTVSVSPTPDSSTTCTPTGTGNTRTCTVTINSNSAGTFTANATAIWSFSDGTNTASVTRSTSGNSGPGGSGSATKRFVDARISLSPLSAVNEVNHVHTITATVQQNDGTGSGFLAAPDGTGVLFSLSSNSAGATFVSGNSCTTSGGTCSVQIISSSAGTVIIHATTTFSVSGISLTRSTGDGLSGDSSDATKRYVDARISVSPLTATNPVGTPHTITATVSQDDGLPAGATGGDAVTGFGPAPNSTLVMFSLTNSNGATATFVGGVNTCSTSGGTGQCSVQINSPTAGHVVIHATTTFNVGGVSLTRATGDGLSGDSADAQKDYVSAAINTGQKLVISDFAKPTGFGTPTGTVTFQLFATSDCSGTPLYSSGPITLVNGLAQTTSSPSLTLTNNGTYNWLVSYSGDANNLPSTSPCGTENTTISGNTPGIVP